MTVISSSATRGRQRSDGNWSGIEKVNGARALTFKNIKTVNKKGEEIRVSKLVSIFKTMFS